MGAHSWPLVFPWQTAISQSSTSPLCSHRSSYSPLCQNSLSDSSSTAGLVQVSAGDLCGFDTIYATFAFCRKKIGLPTLTLESDFCTRDSIFECVLLNPYILFSVFWLFFVTPFSVFFPSHLQYLQMKWPLLDVPGSAGLKDSRSPTPGHLVSKSQNRTKFKPDNDKMCKRGSSPNSWHYRSLTNTLDCCTCTLQVWDVFCRFASVRASERLWNKLSACLTSSRTACMREEINTE